MRLVSLLALAGCWGCWSGTPAPSQPVAPSALVMSQRGVGPIDAATVTTLLGLRKLLPRYRVVPLNDPQLEYDIFERNRRNEKLAFVVLTEGGSGVFNIHVTSAKVTVADRSWRVGKAFSDAKQLSHCECWGENPTCYKTGDHIAVNFDHACLDALDGDLAVLDGVVVQRLIWSPEPFGAPADEPEAAP
jgi:hypothetical protein